MNMVTRQPDGPMAAFGLAIPADLKDIIKGELAQNRQWLVTNISTEQLLGHQLTKGTMARRRNLDHASHQKHLPRFGYDGAAGQEPSRVRRTSIALPVDA